MNGVLKKRSLNGFTLLEVLVVIIIVGVLAGVGMPLMFRNVERARATEAITHLGLMRREFLACKLYEGPTGFTTCDTKGDYAVPTQNSHFTYNINCGSGVCLVDANRNLRDNGDGSSQIHWEWSASDGAFVRKQGSGLFAGMDF
jgi:prepilin-type N-terminal cleavage/methylation domain-containing protein